MSDTCHDAGEMDALQAAPQFHLLLLENEAVRVLEAKVAPGETVPLHTHCWPAVQYIVSWSDFVRRDHSGSIMLDTRTVVALAAGNAAWSGPLPLHTLENVGTGVLHVLSVELKGSSDWMKP